MYSCFSTWPSPERYNETNGVSYVCVLNRLSLVLARAKVSREMVLLALLFVCRLDLQLVRNNMAFEVFSTALVLANKILEDYPYMMSQWANISGLGISQLERWEIEILNNMKYRLHTTSQEWWEWKTLLGRFAVFVISAGNPRRHRESKVSLNGFRAWCYHLQNLGKNSACPHCARFGILHTQG